MERIQTGLNEKGLTWAASMPKNYDIKIRKHFKRYVMENKNEKLTEKDLKRLKKIAFKWMFHSGERTLRVKSVEKFLKKNGKTPAVEKLPRKWIKNFHFECYFVDSEYFCRVYFWLSQDLYEIKDDSNQYKKMMDEFEKSLSEQERIKYLFDKEKYAVRRKKFIIKCIDEAVAEIKEGIVCKELLKEIHDSITELGEKLMEKKEV